MRNLPDASRARGSSRGHGLLGMLCCYVREVMKQGIALDPCICERRCELYHNGLFALLWRQAAGHWPLAIGR